MKRCHHHLNQQFDPYLEFNFEKSLRKYQSPRKKIKKQHTHCVVHIKADQKENSTKKQRKLQGKRSQTVKISKDQLKTFVEVCKVEEGIALNEQNQQKSIQEVEKQEQALFLPQNVEDILAFESVNSFENKFDQPNQSAIKKIERNYLKVKHIESSSEDLILAIEKIQEKEEHQKIQNENIEVDEIIEKHSEIVSQFSLGSYYEQFNSENNIFKEPESIVPSTVGLIKNKGNTEGGRLLINDKISISRRTLSKYLHQNPSTSELLEAILKKRSYLLEQKDQISKKLNNFLKDL